MFWLWAAPPGQGKRTTRLGVTAQGSQSLASSLVFGTGSHSPSLGAWDQGHAGSLPLLGHLPAGVRDLLPFPLLHHPPPVAGSRNRHLLAQCAADQLQEETEQLWIQVSDWDSCWDHFIHSTGHLRGHRASGQTVCSPQGPLFPALVSRFVLMPSDCFPRWPPSGRENVFVGKLLDSDRVSLSGLPCWHRNFQVALVTGNEMFSAPQVFNTKGCFAYLRGLFGNINS